MPEGTSCPEEHPCWFILGIKQTTDADEIRRAYAVRLKATKHDMPAFIALRQAYEIALKGRGPDPVRQPPVPEKPDLPQGALTPPAFGYQLARVLDQRDIGSLNAFLDQALGSTLPLQVKAAYEAAALKSMTGTAAVPVDLLRQLQETFGWGDITHPVARSCAQPYLTFLKRLHAASLHEKLATDAALRNWLSTPAHRRLAAAYLVGKRRPLLASLVGSSMSRLPVAYAKIIQADAPASYEYFDRDRIEWLLRKPSTPRFTASIYLLVFLPVVLVTALVTRSVFLGVVYGSAFAAIIFFGGFLVWVLVRLMLIGLAKLKAGLR